MVSISLIVIVAQTVLTVTTQSNHNSVMKALMHLSVLIVITLKTVQMFEIVHIRITAKTAQMSLAVSISTANPFVSLIDS